MGRCKLEYLVHWRPICKQYRPSPNTETLSLCSRPPPSPAQWQLRRRRRRRRSPPLSRPSYAAERATFTEFEPHTRYASPLARAPRWQSRRAGGAAASEGLAWRRPCPLGRGARGSTPGSQRAWAARALAARACRPVSALDSSSSMAARSPRCYYASP